MIENLPLWINLLFFGVAVISLVFFYLSNNQNKKLTSFFILIAIIQSILAYVGFYQTIEEKSPKILLLLLPTVLFFIYTLRKDNRTKIIEARNTKISTFLHSIRIPVEIGLLYLFYHNMIPELMTFEGRNYDILAGITAPIVGLLYYNRKLSNKALLVWNVLCLGLVLYIMFNGILSAETPLQQFAFDQPNRALAYFPIILLPVVIVPIVIFTHVIDIIKLQKLINAKL